MQAQCMSVFNFFFGTNSLSESVKGTRYMLQRYGTCILFSHEMQILFFFMISLFVPPRRWRSRLERYWPRKRKVGCLNPSHDKPMSFKQVVTTLGNRRECHRSSEMTIMNGCPVSQQVWRAKEPSMLSGHKCRAQVKICSLSLVMMTSPYE